MEKTKFIKWIDRHENLRYYKHKINKWYYGIKYKKIHQEIFIELNKKIPIELAKIWCDINCYEYEETVISRTPKFNNIDSKHHFYYPIMEWIRGRVGDKLIDVAWKQKINYD